MGQPKHGDGKYLENRDASQNWGADIHIVTHTNAQGGCDTNNNYLLIYYLQQNEENLGQHLVDELGPHVVGVTNFLPRGLDELDTNASRGDSYVELQFHDNQFTQKWIYNNSDTTAYLYGLAVDSHLLYP